MSAIADAFADCKKRAALITFITAGFPHADSTPSMLRTMAAAGADILEVGVPFSDPMADGAAIQRSSERALANGMTLAKTLDDIATFRAGNGASATPIILMGYANSFLNYRGGIEGFAKAAGSAGANGLIVVDLADTVRAQWRSALNAANMEMINLIAPTTSAERLQKLAADSQGFVYMIALKGVTGAAHSASSELQTQITAVKKHAKVPVAVGFGVRTADNVRSVGETADGVVVGSRLVEEIENATDPFAAVAAVVGELAEALKLSDEIQT
ncbi:MAG: tryptophan synthase subunit alpha [Gammaproteobacteria bacterium WSBS_2016_MAG_OTU1]